MHFHRDVLAIADTFSAQVVRPRSDDVFAGTPPLAFTFGLGGLVVFPLRVGASTLLIEKATPAELAHHIADHGVTVCFTAPTAYRAMVASGRRRSPVHAEAGGVGGRAPRRDDLARVPRRDRGQAHRRHRRDRDAARVHLRRGRRHPAGRDRSGGAGLRGAGSSTPQGQPVPDGTPGRLAVKGPTGCRYLADPRQKVYVENGWNITGDTFQPGRGRLLLVLRPQRRHDHLVGLQHRRSRGRGGGADPSRRARVRGRRSPRRAPGERWSRRSSWSGRGSLATTSWSARSRTR